MKLQRMIDYNELLVDLASEPLGDEQVVADEDEERAGNAWFSDHGVTVSTAKLFIPDRDPDATVCENDRWWEREDGTIVCLGGCKAYEYGIIIAPGDEPPEIHARRVPSNVVEFNR